MRVFFIVPYPVGQAPSQRFRFEQYFQLLQKNGIECTISSFLDQKTWDIVYKQGHLFKKIAGICRGYMKRLTSLFRMMQFDCIFIHREIAPFGPPVFAFILSKIMRKKLIFDFDDAIWIPNSSEHNKIIHYFKFYSNTNYLAKNAFKVSCGNEFLLQYAKQFNNNVIYNPTTIDTTGYHNKIKDQKTSKFIIGWTGSHSTIQYLNELVPVFETLEKTYTFELHVISDKNPEYNLKSFRFKPWSKSTEIEDLLCFNIGLMPLSNDRWAKGKCGFKALQYMALGIPALVSPVGVNSNIVEDGINGYICDSISSWEKAIATLIEDRALLIKLSAATRKQIIEQYSVSSNSDNFLKLFS